MQVLNTLSASEGAGIEFTSSMNGDKKLIAIYMFRIHSKQSPLALKELEHSQRLDTGKRLQTGHLIFKPVSFRWRSCRDVKDGCGPRGLVKM